MKGGGIRARVLFVALLPVTLGALLLAIYFVLARLDDLETALDVRGAAIARQFAPAAEFGVFSGNTEVLRRLADAVLSEPDVTGLTILDADGGVLVHTGRPLEVRRAIAAGRSFARYGVDNDSAVVFTALIPRNQIAVDDLYALRANAGTGTTTRPLGQVFVQLSRTSLIGRKQELLLSGIVITLIVMLGSAALALRLGREISEPVRELAAAVERVRRGDLNTHVEVRSGGELELLERGIGDMIGALRASHADMEARILHATGDAERGRAEAEAASRTKTRFLAAASHDLRQPMHALGLFVDVLGRREMSAENAHVVAQIRKSVEALQSLLDAMLDIARLDAGTIAPVYTTFPLGPLLERLQAEQLPLARAKGLVLRARPTSLVLRTDAALLERALRNLISNAIRYTVRGGVLVGCRRRGERCRIEVWDTGIGIPAMEMDRIFEEFYQVGNPERDRQKGVGLGLSIVKRLAQLLGQRIRVASRPGRGSVFGLDVPLGAAAQIAESARASSSVDESAMAGKLMVVVEDNLEVGRATGALLREWGCRTIVAASGAEALRRVQAGGVAPDVLIADYRLRDGESGLDVIRAFSLRYGPGMKAMLISGDPAAGELASAAEHAITCLSKPVRPGRLLEVLAGLLAQGD